MSNIAAIQNLRALLVAVHAEPEQYIDLDVFEQKTECGTLHCIAGLATTLPHFQEQEMVLRVLSPRMGNKAWVFIKGLPIESRYAVTDEMFGPDAFKNVFSHAYSSLYDSHVYTQSIGRIPSYKDLAINRIEKQLVRLIGDQV